MSHKKILSKNRHCWWINHVVVVVVLMLAMVAGAADRGRVHITNNSVLTDQNSLLRGGCAWIYKWGYQGGAGTYSENRSYWDSMSTNGLNAARIICFDPWQKTNGYVHWDFTIQNDMNQFVSHLDSVVNLASRYSMYAVITFTDVGTYDIAQVNAFWQVVAPRYKNRTHVVYEIMNEPVSWYPEDYTSTHLADQKAVYDLVRGLAPNTHIILLTFPNTVNEWNSSVTMLSVTQSLSGIDWTNASVGFHTYHTNATSAPIVSLKAHYPCINTEQNLPNYENAYPMDGEAWGQQTMERLGISWLAWTFDGFSHLTTNYINGLLPEARTKGYIWTFDAIGTTAVQRFHEIQKPSAKFLLSPIVSSEQRTLFTLQGKLLKVLPNHSRLQSLFRPVIMIDD